MRMTAAFLLIAGLHASAAIRAQKITLTVRQAPLRTVFKEISRQTGLSVMYDEDMLLQSSPVSLSVKNASLEETLQACLKDQPFMYSLINGAILIRSKEIVPVHQAVDTALQPHSVKIDVHGTVESVPDGGMIPAATISVKGARVLVSANAKGEFVVRNIDINAYLTVSSIGYETSTVDVRGRTEIVIRLKKSVGQLDETQVIAYGTTTRRFSVGAISTVGADEIAQQPVSNVALALQGRVPGLVVTPLGGGIPGAAVRLQVRGQNTLGSTATVPIYDQPLIIVDGIPTASQNNNPTQLLSFVSGTGLSPLNSLNPADIESISVLKDADATSIYGSQGANGVIIITTKRGHSGKTQLNVNVNTGPNSPTENLQMLNTPKYLQLRHDALQLDGLNLATIPSYMRSSFPDLLNFDTTKQTDWVKQFFNRNPRNTDVHVSISGGAGNDSYILTGGLTKTPYNLPGNFADNRLTFHSGAHHSSMNNKFTADFGADFSYDKNNALVSTTPAQAMVLPPDYPDMLTPSGNLVWNYNGFELTNQLYAKLNAPYSMQIFNLNANIKMDYEVLPGLKVGFLTGYSRAENKEYSATPRAAQDPTTSVILAANFGMSVNQSIDIEPQVNYRKQIDKGIFTAILGGTYKQNSGYSNQQNGTGYTDDALLNSIQGAKTITNQDNTSIYKYLGGFARFNYIYANRYILNFTGRRDGSSNFGPSHQYGNFGSVGLGWIFSEENAFKNTLPFISFGKITGDYGTNGTDGVTAYMYQPFYKLYSPLTIPSQFQGTTPLMPVNLYNPNYTWASKHSLNLRMDLGFFKDRVLLGASWYQNRTNNQLTSYPLSSITGFTSVIENMNATVQDRGIEITLTTKNIQGKNFNWSTTFNISANRNKLISFPGLQGSAYAGQYVIGKPTTILYRYKFAGINDTTGVFQFYKGDGKTIVSSGLSTSTVSKGGDYVPIGNTEPVFYGGLGNTFTYKGFSLNIFFQFSKSYARNYMAAIYGSGGGPGFMANYPNFIDGKVWLTPGDNNAIFQRPTTNLGSTSLALKASTAINYFSSSSGSYGDDLYVRLKTLSISYQLPIRWVKAMHVANFSVFANAQNVLTFTNYKFGDPELPGQLYGIPTQRMISGGLNISL